MTKLSFHEKLNIRCGDKCKPISVAPDAIGVIFGQVISFCTRRNRRGIRRNNDKIPRRLQAVDYGVATLRASRTFPKRTAFSGVMDSQYISLKDVDPDLVSAYHAVWSTRPNAQRAKIPLEETLS